MRIVTAVLLGALSFGALAEDLQNLSAEGAALIPPFQQELLGTIKAAMQSGGPTKAVEFCQLLAPEIAAKHSQSPWTVGRTSLKVRNPANAPDAWERKVLQQFADRAAAGEPLAEMKHAEMVGGEFRLMKAIPTGEPCLACHGKEIKPELAAVIDQSYPQDQARNFALGELRGAFSLRRIVEKDPE
ncbi:Tll0287-like domain-containing protein [Pseudomonas brassicacearum]|uniref:DUF3365 domain-containing protein n=1 Tax=Pseudomonas brassicacearum TaxID=930166 RepID=A0AAJ3KXA8_9PSED|nr:DUF3365 domain-containing protein [Pseudomonas brassicacearum]NUT83509.1 DUF3365 domain-containing protein [Pseudomonas brassicacearum]QGA49817.1 DUF3365 domain-containing protein [Pseudomonas brassicacearum]